MNATQRDFDTLLSGLQAKQFKPVYFLHGAEAYYIDALTKHFEQEVLSEAEKAFNQTILYGKDTDHMAVIDTARRFPMMSPYQLVILKEAQEMRTLKELQKYVEKPAATTVFVICYKYKRFNFNSGFGKALKKNATVFEAKGLYDNQVPDWISGYLKGKKLRVEPEAGILLAEYLGTDLSKLSNELDKLALNLPEGTTINAKHIEQNIGISKDYNVFELQKALGQRNILKANRIVQYFASNPRKNPLPVVIGSLYNFYSKLFQYHYAKNLPEKELLSILQLRSAYFLREYRAAARFYTPQRTRKAIATLKSFDLKSKGIDFNNTGKADDALLKEMVWHLLH
ncbi:MAG: DNA polymerase III subunit delta [Bacteroidota bacterium]